MKTPKTIIFSKLYFMVLFINFSNFSTSHSQNMFRRMSNTSELLPMEERLSVIDSYASQLTMSGYSLKQTQDIIINGLRGYERLRTKEMRGQAKLHRPAEDGQEERQRKKILSKANWFKQKSRNIEH